MAERTAKVTTNEKVAKTTARSAIMVALISAIAGISGTLIATYKTPEASYQPVGNRAVALNAEWTGMFSQPMGPDGVPISGTVKFSFEPKTTIVEGNWEIEADRTNGTHLHASYKLRGGFLDNRFLRLQYESSDGTALQFGSVLAELLPDGQTISGSFLGYGAYSRRIVTGTFDVKRQR